MGKIILLLLSLSFLSGCTEDLGGIDLTSANNNGSISATKGQIISVKLDSNITTGYKWNLVDEPDAAVVKFVASRYNTPAIGGVGAGGSEVWQFRAVDRGTTSLRLVYFRPSDPTQFARQFQVTINVE